MRWPLKARKAKPLEGVLRYRLVFAWFPIITMPAWGPSIEWLPETIWLEKVIEVQQYSSAVGWFHSRWYPLNEFTKSLYEHNNQ